MEKPGTKYGLHWELLKIKEFDMKKLALFVIVIIMLSLMATSVVFAKAGVGNPTGEIIDPYPTSEDPDSFTLATDDGDILVIFPEEFEFDFDAFVLGDIVTVKGEWVDEAIIMATDWVKLSEDVEEPEEEGEESEKEGGIYCEEGGKEEPHPVAAKIAEKYEVDVEFVMGYVCDGMGFGEVMLALQMGGDDPEGMLALRKEGQGWGKIWKDAGMIGNEKGDTPPPGLLKKGDDHPGKGPKEDKGPNKP